MIITKDDVKFHRAVQWSSDSQPGDRGPAVWSSDKSQGSREQDWTWISLIIAFHCEILDI